MTNTNSCLIDDFFKVIVLNPENCSTSSPQYRIWRAALAHEIKARFSGAVSSKKRFGPIGPLSLPYFEMGAITSLELFGLDELILFAFYNANRDRYRRVVDFGANLGLHTIILARCGFEVRSFEPDPVHLTQLRCNLKLNQIETDLIEAAVSLENTRAEFVRVKGNTTGSHLAGSKRGLYGELDRFEVTVTAAAPHLAWADLAKIDIEGHEAELITGLPSQTWLETDAVVEVGTSENAQAIYKFLIDTDVKMFSQKTGWDQVVEPSDMPTSHREGSLFLTGKTLMPWKNSIF
jgi:FkbM family methyltransferase